MCFSYQVRSWWNFLHIRFYWQLGARQCRSGVRFIEKSIRLYFSNVSIDSCAHSQLLSRCCLWLFNIWNGRRTRHSRSSIELKKRKITMNFPFSGFVQTDSNSNSNRSDYGRDKNLYGLSCESILWKVECVDLLSDDENFSFSSSFCFLERQSIHFQRIEKIHH